MFNYKQLEEWLLEELRRICQQNHIFIAIFGQPKEGRARNPVQ